MLFTECDSFITKFDRYIAKCDDYYKVQQNRCSDGKRTIIREAGLENNYKMMINSVPKKRLTSFKSTEPLDRLHRSNCAKLIYLSKVFSPSR